MILYKIRLLGQKFVISYQDNVNLSTYWFGSQGVGTDDGVLIEILASRTSEQIKDIIKVYKKGDFHLEQRQTEADLMFTFTVIQSLKYNTCELQQTTIETACVGTVGQRNGGQFI